MLIQKVDEKKVVGLTGSFGSGKSSVAQYFREFGAEVAEADQIAKEALRPEKEPYAELVKHWGKSFLLASGEVDRTKVAELIFSDESKRREIESWIHPYVFTEMSQVLKSAKKPFVVFEVPLLFETGFDRDCDWIVSVQAPQNQIIERLLKKGFSEEDIRKRFRSQWTQAEKNDRSDFVITNDSTLEELRQASLRVWEAITSQTSKDFNEEKGKGK